MDYEAILWEQDARGIVTLTLNRPEALNTWNDRMRGELEHALRRADEDDAIRVLILTGAGRAFCAGQDLSGGGDTFEGDDSGSGGDAGGRPDGWPRLTPRMIRKPVIAAINGHAIGVGVTYAMTCDIRIVAEDAKCQFAFSQRGLIPELGAHAIVPRVIGMSNALDVLLTGRMMSGREFARRGLASEAVPAEEVLPAAKKLAEEFLLAAPSSVAISKRLVWDALERSVEETEQREIGAYPWVGSQDDAREGIMAFLEKRAPEWTVPAPERVPGSEDADD